jgi:cardiolipin synthase
MPRLTPPFAVLTTLCLAACATIPNARELAATPDGRPPLIEGSQKPLPAGQSQRAIEQMARFSGDDEKLQRQVALEGQIEGTPLIAGNQVTLLQNGPPTYDAMMRAIIASRSNISLESFTIEDDSIGTALADLLIEKSRAGVKVQVIYDSDGSADTLKAFWGRLRAAGIQVLEYNPLNPFDTRVPYQPNDRDHRKLLVVDGRTAILGGINISEIYLYGGVKPRSTDRFWVPWRDTDIEVEGPAVAELEKFFVDVWTSQRGPELPPTVEAPPLPAAGPSYVRAVPGTPQQGDPEIYIALLSAIRHAEKNVWITTAFFDPTEEARRVLAGAARRGVDVELSVPGQSDSQVTLAAGRSRYDELLRAGVKIYERRDVFLHAKTATIDGVWSIVGSSNLDARSVIWNNELSAIVLGRDFARQMETAFLQDRAAGMPIERPAWENRPFAERLQEWSARVFEPLL